MPPYGLEGKRRLPYDSAAMTSKDLEAELSREPFIPLRLHLVSGKTVSIPSSGTAWLLQNALLVFQNVRNHIRVGSYDVIAFRNIERIEQRPSRMASRQRQ